MPTTADIKINPADSILRFAPANEKKARPKGALGSRRLLGYGARAAGVVCLCGLAWAGGTYYPLYALGQSPLELMKQSPVSETQQDAGQDEMLRAMGRMAEEIRALKAGLEGRALAQDGGVANAKSRDPAARQPDLSQTTTGAAIADLASRIDRLEADSTAKFARLSEQLAGIEQQMAASHAALAPPAQPSHKRIHLHDAFDPSKDPMAPGAPRQLGTR